MYMPWLQLTHTDTDTETETERESSETHRLHMFHLRVCLCNLQLHKTANKVANITIHGGLAAAPGAGGDNEQQQRARRQNAKKSTFCGKGLKRAIQPLGVGALALPSRELGQQLELRLGLGLGLGLGALPL